MQGTQFHAKNVKNDLKPMDFLERNYCFKTKGVSFISFDFGLNLLPFLLALVLISFIFLLHRSTELLL